MKVSNSNTQPKVQTCSFWTLQLYVTGFPWNMFTQQSCSFVLIQNFPKTFTKSQNCWCLFLILVFLVILFSVANRTSGVIEAWIINHLIWNLKFCCRFYEEQIFDNNFKMSEAIPQELLNELKATNGQVITCKAAVAWEPKKPLDITDIQVSMQYIHTYFLTHMLVSCATKMFDSWD